MYDIIISSMSNRFERFDFKKNNSNDIGRRTIRFARYLSGNSQEEAALNTKETDRYNNEAILGNRELPIFEFRQKILDSVNENSATIISAETGSGKTTQVPQFLAEEGYKVIVTQPRILAARSVSERVGDEVVEAAGSDFEDFVGYRTARERKDSPENRILFVTDGLEMVRSINNSSSEERRVLVLDEVHEWNINMEVLVAWSRRRMQEDPNLKIVAMSATMDSDKLAKFFQGDESDKEVPVINVPGRTFPVSIGEGDDVLKQTKAFAESGKNTLVFVPGKGEINYLCSELEGLTDAVVLPLHGDLDPNEQKRVFKKYDKPKIVVATNIAQTSITIDDINAVVDSGLERQSMVKNNIEGLYLNPISKADCLQRAGRAGRTQPGEYVLAPLSIGLNRLPFNSLNKRREFPIPAILRDSLDSTVLHLARAGIDASDLEFFHQPEKTDIQKSKDRLFGLGALDNNGEITKIGREMEKLSMDPHYARMMIEARKYGDNMRCYMAGVLAIQSVGGILKSGKTIRSNGEAVVEPWRSLVKKVSSPSSILQEYEVFSAAQRMSKLDMRENGIMVKNFHNAREVMNQIRRHEKLSDYNLETLDEEQIKNIIKCIIAGGIGNIFMPNGGRYKDLHGREYIYGKGNLVNPRESLMIGTPRIIQTKRGGELLLVEDSTFLGKSVRDSYELVSEVVPHLCKEGRYFVDYDGRLKKDNGLFISGTRVSDQYYDNIISVSEIETDEQRELIIKSALGSFGSYEDCKIGLNNKYTGRTEEYSLGDLRFFSDKIADPASYKEKIEKVLRDNITNKDVAARDLLSRCRDSIVSEIAPGDVLNEISENYPQKLPYIFDKDDHTALKDIKYHKIKDGENGEDEYIQGYMDFYFMSSDSVREALLSRFFEKMQNKSIHYLFDKMIIKSADHSIFEIMKEYSESFYFSSETLTEIMDKYEAQELKRIEMEKVRAEAERKREIEMMEHRLEEERMQQESREKYGAVFSSHTSGRDESNPFSVLSGLFEDEE